MESPALLPAPVLSKRDFTTRYLAGEFGNASPSWSRLSDFVVGGRNDGTLYHLRNRNLAGGSTYYNQTWMECVRRWINMADQCLWYASEMVPRAVERTLLLQGEVQQAVPGCGRCGLELYYTTIAKPMRQAMAEQAATVWGLKALAILQTSLCANSYEWLQELIKRYPGHVIEFSTYRCRWGTLPDFNTVFWEVRRY